MRALLLVGLCLSLGCTTKERPAWPDAKPEVDTLAVREGVVEVPKAVTNAAKVRKDALVFPASAASAVMSQWPAGAIMVGKPADDMEGRRQNPFGFMRKVKAVRVVGDEVVVDTEPAKLDEVLVGQLHRNVDLTAGTQLQLPEGADLSDYDVQVSDEGTDFPIVSSDTTEQPLTNPTEPGPSIFGKKRQGLNVTGPSLNVPEVPLTLMTLNKAVKLPAQPIGGNISGQVRLTPLVHLAPRMVLDWDGNIVEGLKEFQFTVGVDGTIGAKADINYNLTTDPTLSARDLLSLKEYLRSVPVTVNPPPLPIGEPILQESTIGIVPVVYVFGAYLSCDLTVSGSARVTGQMTVRYNPEFGIKYKKKQPKYDWAPYSAFPFSNPQATANIVGDSTEAELDCGVMVRADLLVAGLAGPYAQIRSALVTTAKYTETCAPNDPAPKDHPGDRNLALGVKSYTALQVGVELTLLKIISVGKGPYNILRYEMLRGPAREVPNPAYREGIPFTGGPTVTQHDWLDIWSTKKTWPNSATASPTFGKWCQVQCDDQQKNGNETDVDCGGSCAKCTKNKACTANADCISNICGGNGLCVASLCEDNVKGQLEVDVDCGGPQCPACPAEIPDGRGGTRPATCLEDSDCAAPAICSDDGTMPRECTFNLCRDGRRSGAESDVDCGAAEGCTRRCANFQRCLSSADCASGACRLDTRQCVANACLDGAISGDETDADCGGSCQRKCELAQTCATGADCVSGLCSAENKCVATLCQDRRLTPGEVGTDCSGNCTARCPVNEACNADTDCVTGLVCNIRTRRCATPGCDDGIKNGQETAIDCGGSTCAKCALSKACAVNSDCVSDQCFNGRCVSGPCENGVKDGAEADVDCGAACGRLCGAAATCGGNTDCASGLCVTGRCVSDLCQDRVRDGAEADVDCGGPTCSARCATNQRCGAGNDCASGLCNMATLRCVGGPCEDGLLTVGSESDVDCGGSCGAASAAKKCAVNKRCATSSDCASGVCNATTLRCVPNACFDGVKNGTETDLDCGGSCEPKCAATKLCSVNADCQSGACNTTTGRCSTDQCSDGRMNGSETAVDCGGSCPTRCAPGSACLTGNDCNNPGMVGVPGFCSAVTSLCSATSCTTGAKDGDETGVDCGGSCAAKCPVGQGCSTGLDCSSGFCNGTTRLCVATRCEDGVRNGTETDVDCGGYPTCGGCATGRGCQFNLDCASLYCSASNVCVGAPRTSCSDAYRFDNHRVDGLVQLDIDGPWRGGVAGINKPVLTYCANASLPEYTPVLYLNSGGNQFTSLQRPLDRFMKNFAVTGPATCTSGSACPIAGDVCRRVDNSTGGICDGGTCFCIGNGNWDPTGAPQLNGNPNNFSIPGAATADMRQFSYKLNPVGQPNYGGFAGQNGYHPTHFRWTAYRYGVKVFDSRDFEASPPSVPATSLPSWASNGQFKAGTNPFPQNWGWCQDDGTYGTSAEPIPYGLGAIAPFPYNDNSGPSGTRTVESRCLRSGNAVLGMEGQSSFASNPYANMSSMTRFTPEPDTFPPYKFSGLWFGRYGDTDFLTFARWTPSAMTRLPTVDFYMGICNSMQDSAPETNFKQANAWCQPVHHPTEWQGGATTFSWGAGENTGGPNNQGVYTSGSAFGYRIPGLVFVLWAL